MFKIFNFDDDEKLTKYEISAPLNTTCSNIFFNRKINFINIQNQITLTNSTENRENNNLYLSTMKVNYKQQANTIRN